MKLAKLLFLQFVIFSCTVTLMADQKKEAVAQDVITAPVSNYQKICKDMESLQNKKRLLNTRIDELLLKIKKLSCKNIEIEIWIEVQRSLSYSPVHFQNKTRNSSDLISKNKKLIKTINKQLTEIYKNYELILAELKDARKKHQFLIESSSDINFQTVFHKRN